MTHDSGLRTTQRGFTLLLAALISSIVLSIGAAIYGIAIKELQLSTLGRNSQYAFFAADTGAECALYWDVRYAYFASTTPAGVSPKCDAQDLTVSTSQGTPPTYPYTKTFQFQTGAPLGSPTKYCTVVSVTKCQGAIQTDGSCTNSGTIIQTQIHADGYDVACSEIATSNRALQRSVELHY